MNRKELTNIYDDFIFEDFKLIFIYKYFSVVGVAGILILDQRLTRWPNIISPQVKRLLSSEKKHLSRHYCDLLLGF